jgi:hypothetical protein
MTTSVHAERITRRWSAKNRTRLIAGALILLGIAPGIGMIWYGSQGFPLSVPITLARGQYTSPWFTPGVSDMWDIDLKWPHIVQHRNAVSIDWKVVDERGSYIGQGAFDSKIVGNVNLLGLYKSKRGIRQRVILDVHDGVTEEIDAHPTLKIEDPHLPEDMAFAFPLALFWAVIVAGCGLIVLIVGARRRDTAPDSASGS